MMIATLAVVSPTAVARTLSVRRRRRRLVQTYEEDS